MKKTILTKIATILLITTATVYVVVVWSKLPKYEDRPIEQTSEINDIEKPLVKETIQEKNTVVEPKNDVAEKPQGQVTNEQPVYTPPQVIINNTNIQIPPAETPTIQTKPEVTTTAPEYTEPAPQTNLEIAQQIVELYDQNGKAEYWGSNGIRVTAYGGKTVTIDIVTGWEEKLKLTLNKIK